MEKNYGKNPEVAKLLKEMDDFEERLKESTYLGELEKRIKKLEKTNE